MGVDFSPAAVRQARADAERLCATNVRFIRGTVPNTAETPFDAVIAIFFLHHLPDESLTAKPRRGRARLRRFQAGAGTRSPRAESNPVRCG